MLKSIYYQNRNSQIEEDYVQNLPTPKIYIEYLNLIVNNDNLLYILDQYTIQNLINNYLKNN